MQRLSPLSLRQLTRDAHCGQTHNLKVVGSNPTPATKNNRYNTVSKATIAFLTDWQNFVSECIRNGNWEAPQSVGHLSGHAGFRRCFHAMSCDAAMTQTCHHRPDSATAPHLRCSPYGMELSRKVPRLKLWRQILNEMSTDLQQQYVRTIFDLLLADVGRFACQTIQALVVRYNAHRFATSEQLFHGPDRNVLGPYSCFPSQSIRS